MRIAVIGSGIAGLYSAHTLARQHEVVLFEAEDRIGGHTHTVDVCIEGEEHSVDTGFIVYNEKTYPLFIAMLEEHGVETKPTDMSFGMHCDRTGVEWASRGLTSVFAQRRNLASPGFLRMVADILRFNREAPALIERGDASISLERWVRHEGYSNRFLDHYLVPMGAAIWSATRSDFLRFPAISFVRFFENHGLLATRPDVRWRVISGGSNRYTEALMASFGGKVELGTPVQEVRRCEGGVDVAAHGSRERFDHVVIATHSDQALGLLADPTRDERQVLSSIRYQPNEVVLHTDESLLPMSPRARASWNYRVPDSGDAPACVTYDMNRLQGIESDHRFLVTLGATDLIDESRILRTFTYSHPVLDGPALAAQKLRTKISGRERIHYAGAYWGYGFHEDGMRSAVAVCRELGVEV